MVLVVFVLSGLAFGSMASISVFLKPVSLEFGWTRGQTSFAYTVASFSSAAYGVIRGQVADKYGTCWYGFVGAICMSLILFILSGMDSIFQFYLLYFLFGAMGSALLFLLIISGILIESLGWKSAYVNLAFIYISIALPISFLIKESPWRISARSDDNQDDVYFALSEKGSFMDQSCCYFLLYLYGYSNYALGSIID